MPKKYKPITDEELDRLFRDAAENFRNGNPPEGAWENFYAKNGQQLKGNAAGSVTDLNKKPGSSFTRPKVYRAAAVWLMLIVSSLVAWFIVAKPGNETEITRSVIIADSAVGAVAPIARDGVQDTAGLNSRLLPGSKTKLHAPYRSLAAGGTRQYYPVQPGYAEESLIHSAAGQSPFMQVPLALPHQTDKANDQPQGNSKKIELATEPQQYPNKGYYETNRYFPGRKPADESSSSGKWQLGLVGGANIAMVKGDVSTTPGLNTGILVQHRINESRVSVESGVIYENMTYAVENEYFNPGGNPVSSKVSNISGTCTMIDMPVNVRYDMVHSKKRKAFVSTGVSPTVMVKQSYVYDYTDENGTRLIDRDVTGQGKNFYAVANLSVGYEQKWNKISVQVAPYLKIPMGDVGYGNLSLGGIGTQISIKRDL